MLFLWFIIHVKSDSPTPSNLTTTYKSPSTVLLEWMFSDPVVGDTMYTVYYQSGGVSYNTSFTLTEDQRSYLMMDLPLEVITNVFIVTVTRMENHLPSPLVGPASLGRLLQLYTFYDITTLYGTIFSKFSLKNCRWTRWHRKTLYSWRWSQRVLSSSGQWPTYPTPQRHM